MRKLATASLSFSAAIFAANYILPASWLLPLTILFAAIGAAALVLRRDRYKAVKIVLFAVSLGLFCFLAHAEATTVPAAALSDETREITAEVLTFPNEADNYISFEARLKEDGLPPLRMLVYDNYGYSAELRPGQTISFTGKLRRADIRYGLQDRYYNGIDIYLTVNMRKDGLTLIEDAPGLRHFPAYIGHAVSETVGNIFPGDVSPFMKSLLAGDRAEYNRDVQLKTTMSHAGFAHVIAVSGMHVAFLVGFIMLIMGKSRISSLVCIALVWIFVFTTGASPSALRAGLMQSFILFAPVAGRENDYRTTLSTALALILIFNPYAASSVSLQLSFGAMSGIVLLCGKIYEALMKGIGNGRARKILSFPAKVTASSLAVLVFTAPLTALYFGYLSILAPLTNIIAIWAVSFCFAGGYAACALSSVGILGRLLAEAVSWAARYIFFVVRTIGSLRFSVLYFENRLLILWLAAVYIILTVFALIRKNSLKRIFAAVLLSVLLLAAALLKPTLDYRRGGTMAAVDVGQGQCLAVMEGENTVLIDCGSTGSGKNAGEIAASYLGSRGRGEIDLLILTHLHADHANGVETLMELVPVEKIVIQSEYDDENGLLPAITESAERHGTELIFMDEDRSFQTGGIRAELYAPSHAGKANERCITAKISIHDYDMIVTGDVSKNAEKEMAKKHDISDSEILIVGHHGSKYASADDFLTATGANKAIISVGYNTYGHPTEEVLERLDKYGYQVFRTDEDGTVEFRLGREYG